MNNIEIPKFDVELEQVIAWIEKQTESHKPDGRPIKWIKGKPLTNANDYHMDINKVVVYNDGKEKEDGK